MYSINRLTDFIHVHVYGFDPESCSYNKNSFYFETGQHIDLLSAYLYAQDHILPFIKAHGIEKITEEMLLKWIFALHTNIGKHLLASFEKKSGEYAIDEVIRWQQGWNKFSVIRDLIDSLESFDAYANLFIANYSKEHNLSIQTCTIFVEIIKRYRKESMIALSGKLKTIGKNSALVEMVIDKIRDASRNGNLSTEENTALAKIMKFGIPVDKIPQAMKGFSENTLRHWKNLPGKNTTVVANVISEIFYQLTHIHPFPNCNGRTATCLMNIILKSIGLPDIVLRYPGERNDSASDYEKVMAVIEDTRKPFAAHILDCINKAQHSPFHNVKLAELIQARVVISLRCQALEKISPSFNFNKFLKQIMKSSSVPAGLSQEDENLVIVRDGIKILEEIENKSTKKCTNDSLFSKEKNPFVLYKEALGHLNLLRYERAISTLLLAITGFTQKSGTASIQIAKCHSALASSYRENNQFNLAVNACESALLILEKIENSEELALITKKYAECLYLHKQPPMKLYNLSITNYKEKHFHIALSQLQYCLCQWQTQKGNEHKTGIAYSTMASCYRELSNMDEALKYCDLAMTIFTNNPETLKDIQTKREGILALVSQSIECPSFNS